MYLYNDENMRLYQLLFCTYPKNKPLKTLLTEEQLIAHIDKWAMSDEEAASPRMKNLGTRLTVNLRHRSS